MDQEDRTIDSDIILPDQPEHPHEPEERP